MRNAKHWEIMLCNLHRQQHPVLSSQLLKPTISSWRLVLYNWFKTRANLEEDLQRPERVHQFFLEIYDTQKHDGVSPDAIRLILFPFSIKDKPKILVLFSTKGDNYSMGWDVSTLLAKYLPPAKVTKLRSNIMTFSQLNDESVHDAWRGTKFCSTKHQTVGYPHGYRSCSSITNSIQIQRWS